jgi:hypothetical protein
MVAFGGGEDVDAAGESADGLGENVFNVVRDGHDALFVAEYWGLCYGELMDENGSEEPAFVHDDLPAEKPQRDDLDERRIKQLAKLRRAAHRSRGYLLVASVLCVALAGQLVWVGIGRYRVGWVVMAAGLWLSAPILLALAWRAWIRAKELKVEAERSALEEPRTPPDFEKLSDGSQAWRNLEDVE